MNIDLFFGAPPVIIAHTAFAVLSLVAGIIMLVRRKGTYSHKMMGRFFALCMAITAATAIFIRVINNGKFSFIHIFVIVTFFGLWNLFRSIRKKDISKHKRTATALFFGALLIPGLFSFMPGRLLWNVFFG